MTDLADEARTDASGDAARWRALVDKVLKGADFDRVLTSRTFDGLRIAPLYPKAEGEVPRALRAASGPWTVMQRVDHPDVDEANRLALDDLENGAGGLVLSFMGAAGARGFGLGEADAEALDLALAGVHLDLITLRLETAPFAGHGPRAAIAELAERRGLDPAALTVDFGLDPLGDAVRTAHLPAAWPEMERRIAEAAVPLIGRGFAGSVLTVDTRPHHEAGAAEAQELAAALGTGVAYLRALEAGGVPLDRARAALVFLLVADTDEFLTVAKFRAFRRLWAAVERACGLDPKPIRLLAETAWRSTTRRDPWVNLLRGTIAAFSAVVGGADALTVLPYTAPLGLADGFGRRLARNTQAILAEEAHLWRVADPAAGAGGFEALTDELAAAAWRLFQEIEAGGEIEVGGGMAAALASGAWQQRLAGTREARSSAVARRMVQITGTSEYPNLAEAPVAVLKPIPAPAPAAAVGEGAVTFAPFAFPRLAEPFERLRDAAEAGAAATGRAATVFLAGLGSPASFNARAGFARAAFEAGGIAALGNEARADLTALVAEFRASGAGIACLCGSDDTYAAPVAEGQDETVAETVAEAAARAFAEAGATLVVLAGRPGEREAALRAAGIGAFLFAGDDLVAFLSAVQSAAGIAHNAAAAESA